MRAPIKAIAVGAVAILALGGNAACSSDADVAAENLAKASDNFEIYRKIVQYNSFTDKYILEIDGYCSVDAADPKKIAVTCKAGKFIKRHLLGITDNTPWFAEQLDGAAVGTGQYRVNFKPESIIPDVVPN